MIKNIIFDLGNVLLDFNPLDYLKNLFNNEEIENLLFTEVFKSKEWIKLDEGTITQEEAIKIFSLRNPQNELHIKECMDNWIDILTPIEETVKVLYELKEKGYKLYMLSNFHSLAFEKVSNKYDFFKCFDGGVISYKENLLKPNIEIFDKLINAYNLNAEESLFLDDTLINVEAAEKIGLATIHVTNTKELRNLLQNLITL